MLDNPPTHTPTDDLLREFATALRPQLPLYLQPASTEYVSLFWRAYLGAAAFALYDVLVCTQRLIQAGQVKRWPTINVLADACGLSSRHAILGRAKTARDAAQPGALVVLVDEMLVAYLVHGEDKGTRYEFEVRDHLPMLTPLQAKKLPANLQKLHRKNFVDRLPQATAQAYLKLVSRSFVK